MTKVIVEKNEDRPEIYNGQIREDSYGRIIMVITDERYVSIEDNSRTIRSLVLREGRDGFCEPFTTIPRIYESNEELINAFPKVLNGTFTIKEEE